MEAEELIGFSASYNFQLSHHLFTGRIITGKSYQELKLPVEKIFETSLLYGYGVNDSRTYANISVGFAYVSISRRIFDHKDSSSYPTFDVYHSQQFHDVGIAWQANVFTKFSDSSKLGFGVSLSGNVNKPGSFFFLLFNIEYIIF